MSTHTGHAMHPNSLAAYQEERKKLNGRSKEVYEAFDNLHRPATDREIMNMLRLPEPNAVRPRITELTRSGLLVEVGKVTCAVTGKKVRICEVTK